MSGTCLARAPVLHRWCQVFSLHTSVNRTFSQVECFLVTHSEGGPGMVCPPSGHGLPSVRAWSALHPGMVCPPSGHGLPSIRAYFLSPLKIRRGRIPGLVLSLIVQNFLSGGVLSCDALQRWSGHGLPSVLTWSALRPGMVCPPSGHGLPSIRAWSALRRGMVCPLSGHISSVPSRSGGGEYWGWSCH
jgi:hypothetical protein